jgi:ubiquinone/menaquinone biosynthesis C-methylase UbiE
LSRIRNTDPGYLLGHQYRDSSNLEARMELHERFSTNHHGWPRWVFEQMSLVPGTHVLELGSGTAALWQANRERLPIACTITLSDLSPGMQRAAREQLGPLANRFDWAIVDAQAIPYDAQSFDVVIANHMLYHVPDRDVAIGEIRRVLRADGVLYAATNGEAHLCEMDELLFASAPEARRGDAAEHFSLENGEAQLRRHFSRAVVTRYPDSLEVTTPETLLRYLLSTSARDLLNEQRLSQMHARIAAEIAASGAFHVTKATGLFTAFV